MPNVAADDFWSKSQPGFRFTSELPGTPAFFAAVERHRYTLEPHIPEMVGFERWRGLDVLEVGCGIGTDGINFARAGARYTGLDQSVAAISLARQRFDLESQEGRFVEGALPSLPLSSSSFDLVYSHGVIHHIEDTERAVAEFARVLRPTGTALVMVYHRNSLNYRFTILVVRRLLAGLLLVPGAISAVGRLTGEDAAVLEGHRQLLKTHGLRYLTASGFFLSNNTDGPGNPLSKVFSESEIRELFARQFDRLDTRVRYLNLRAYPNGEQIAATALARRLERRIGWHLYVEARVPKALNQPRSDGPEFL